jgi:hypothetical protein
LQDDKSPSKKASKQKQRVLLLFQGRSSQIRHENRNSDRADRKKNKEEEEEEEEDGENGHEETEQAAGILVVKQTKEKIRKKIRKKGGKKRAEEFGGRCSNEAACREQRNGNRSGKGKPRRCCSRVPMTTREEEDASQMQRCAQRKRKGQKGIRRFLPFFQHSL